MSSFFSPSGQHVVHTVIPNLNPAPYQVEVPATETPKRASAAAELPQTEVRTKRTCAGRKAAAK